MNVLITGGSGYIGSRVIQYLAQHPDVEEITNIDQRPLQFPAPFLKVKTISADVTHDLRPIFLKAGKPTVAIHAAWTVDPLRDAQRQRAVCIQGTQRFLQACHQAGIQHILFISSATAYGAHPEHGVPLAETAGLRPTYHFQYSAEKREAEALFQTYAHEHPHTLIQIVRPVVVGGPNVSNYIFRAVTRPVVFQARGFDPPMQLVHEEDVARAIAAILHSRVPGCFNLAGAGTVTLSQIYQRLGAQRILRLPLPLLLTLTDWAWKLGWTGLTEAPAGMIYFMTYPWLVATDRVQQAVGFQFQYTTDQVIESFLQENPRSPRLRSHSSP